MFLHTFRQTKLSQEIRSGIGKKLLSHRFLVKFLSRNLPTTDLISFLKTLIWILSSSIMWTSMQKIYQTMILQLFQSMKRRLK